MRQLMRKTSHDDTIDTELYLFENTLENDTKKANIVSINCDVINQIPPWSSDSVLDLRSLPPVFESLLGLI